jgi:glutathione S-transferase
MIMEDGVQEESASPRDGPTNGQRQQQTLTFYDRITSNNAARIRLWIRLKKLSSEFRIAHTSHADQLSSDDFASLNPNRRIPLLLLEDGLTALPESAVILQYLEERFASVPPSLLPPTPEERARMNLAIRYHDLYIASPNSTHGGGPPYGLNCHAQSCFYVPPAPDDGEGDRHRGLSPGMRAAKLADVWRQLDVLEGHCSCDPYLSGPYLTLADVTLLPTAFCVSYYGPRTFGWDDGAVWAGRPKLRRWYHTMLDAHEEARDVVAEMEEELDGSEDVRVRIGSIRRQVEDHPHCKWIYP